MRFVDRSGVTPPDALVKKDGLGEKETVKAIEFYSKLADKDADGKKTRAKFPFKAYKNDTVKRVLESMFYGKCAYCENRYASIHPVDIEHWRPKAEVMTSAKPPDKKRGYYWLAAKWDNLLPSCIDCNRVREHIDFIDGETKLLGKGNWFPLTDETTRTSSPLEDSKEVPLLLNPCVEDPSQYLVFHDEGFVSARVDPDPAIAEKGRASIRFYALNRSELVEERRRVLLQIKYRMFTVERLARSLNNLPPTSDIAMDLEDLLAHELNILNEFKDPIQPFSTMATQVINRFIENFRK